MQPEPDYRPELLRVLNGEPVSFDVRQRLIKKVSQEMALRRAIVIRKLDDRGTWRIGTEHHWKIMTPACDLKSLCRLLKTPGLPLRPKELVGRECSAEAA